MPGGCSFHSRLTATNQNLTPTSPSPRSPPRRVQLHLVHMRAAARLTEQAPSFSSRAPLMEAAVAAGGLPLEPSSLDAVAAPAPAPVESAAERRRHRDRDGGRRHRRRVAALYAELEAMLPALSTARHRRVTREEVLVAAAARVQALEDAAAALEGYRVRPRPGHEVTVPSRGTVTVSVRLPAPAPAGALRRVVEAFERRGVRVLVATMARHGAGAAVVVTVTAAAVAPEVVELIRADIATIIS